MGRKSVSEDAEAVARGNAEEVQGKGRFEVFEEIFADDFVAHTHSLEQRQTDLLKPHVTELNVCDARRTPS